MGKALLGKIITCVLLMVLALTWLRDADSLSSIAFWYFILLATIPSFMYWILRTEKAMSKRQKKRYSQHEGVKEGLPLVSILIPAWNEGVIIDRSVKSVLQVDYPAFEMIIVAGGEDDTYQKATKWAKRDKKVRVVKQQPLGKNAALNEGLRYANGDIIVLLDADTIVSQEWLKSLISPIICGEALATTGNHFPDKEMNWVLSYECMVKIRNRYLDNDNSLFGGASIAISKHVLNELGGFSEKIIAGVDWHLYTELARREVKTMFVPNAKVKTNIPTTFTHFLKTEIRWKRALFWLSLKAFGNIHIKRPREIVKLLRENIFFLTPFLFTLFPYFLLMYILEKSSIFSVFWFSWVFYFSLIMLSSTVLAVEVYLYTGQRCWLRYLWVPPTLLILEFIYTIYAILTFTKLELRFKGPRKL